MMGRLIRNPKIPAPRKFQKPTATRNMTAQRCGNGICERASWAATSCRNDHASTVRNVSGMTSAAEKNEHVGDHHRGEELEEVLDPQVHDPEAPELGGGEVVRRAGDQADGVER